MVYREYFDPEQLRADARDNLPQVHALLDALHAGAAGVDLAPRLLLYGFSRGAQMAHRFAMAYPAEVAGVAVLSAGSYTLPDPHDVGAQPMLARFDPTVFASIPFWIGVGGEDVNAADTARAWDTFEGQTRVDRAQAFAAHLQAVGNPVDLHVFGGAGHEATTAMRESACGFLASHER
jgi:pimeloyl-ACP methyl ester carboxylesterase